MRFPPSWCPLTCWPPRLPSFLSICAFVSVSSFICVVRILLLPINCVLLYVSCLTTPFSCSATSRSAVYAITRLSISRKIYAVVSTIAFTLWYPPCAAVSFWLSLMFWYSYEKCFRKLVRVWSNVDFFCHRTAVSLYIPIDSMASNVFCNIWLGVYEILMLSANWTQSSMRSKYVYNVTSGSMGLLIRI